MSILVTGGGGFVGINVADELIAQGKSAVLFDLHGLPACADKVLRKREPKLAVVAGDVRDPKALENVCRDFGVKQVIHTAAITAGPARESREPNEIIDVNMRGTVNVLEAARRAGCLRVVYVGSGAAYGTTHYEGAILREEVAPSRPEGIYGITKFAAEQTALRLGTLWGLHVVCVRIGSVCGPWEFDTGVRDRLSPQHQVARLAIRGEAALLPEKEVWRDWVYSRDVAAGLVAVLEARDPKYTFYHLSSGVDWRGSFVHWCDTLKNVYPRFSWRIAASAERPNVSVLHERDRAQMDIGRIVQDIGFKPRFGPREAYRDYIDWVQENKEFIAVEARAAAQYEPEAVRRKSPLQG